MDSDSAPQPEAGVGGGAVAGAESSPPNLQQETSPEPGGWVKFEDESGSSKTEGMVLSDSAASTPKRVVRPRPEDFSPVPEQENADRMNRAVAAVISAETTHVNVSRSSVSRSPVKPIDTKVDLHTINLRETNGTSSPNTSTGIIRQGFGKNFFLLIVIYNVTCS